MFLSGETWGRPLLGGCEYAHLEEMGRDRAAFNDWLHVGSSGQWCYSITRSQHTLGKNTEGWIRTHAKSSLIPQMLVLWVFLLWVIGFCLERRIWQQRNIAAPPDASHEFYQMEGIEMTAMQDMGSELYVPWQSDVKNKHCRICTLSGRFCFAPKVKF